MQVSRFNPTVNGPLHIGHIYNVLVIQALADKFILRFDDNQFYWLSRLGKDKVAELAEKQLDSLLWMGIEPQDVTYQSKQEGIVYKAIAKSPHFRGMYTYGERPPVIVSEPHIEAWGPDFSSATEKVILDHAAGVTVAVRGLELLQENALYLYLCGIFGYQAPRMIYIPRLMCHDGELADISKTQGNYKIDDLRREGASPEQIKDTLRRACLRDPSASWGIENLKGAPVLRR